MDFAASELTAVNTMLQTIGETPTTTLSGTLPYEVDAALEILTETTKDVLSQGWDFNTEYDVVLTPDGSTKRIVLGTNIARVDLEDENKGSFDLIMKYVSTEWRLYDRVAQTYEFDSTIKATIVYFYDFVGIPHPAQHYITARAARIYSDRFVGSRAIHEVAITNENVARARLMDFQGSKVSANMLEDSASVSNFLKRTI